MSSSAIVPELDPSALPVAWSYDLGLGARHLCLARESHYVFLDDEKDRLYLLDARGKLQAQRAAPGNVVCAAVADDGSAYAAAGRRNEVWKFAPDLGVCWKRTTSDRPLALALDAFGKFLAYADVHGSVCVLDEQGQLISRLRFPRPIQHIVFVPEASRLVACADYGLVASFDIQGKTLWRDSPVANVGALTCTGDGERLLLACYSEGLRCYDKNGKISGALPLQEPCRLAVISYDGARIVTSGLARSLLILDGQGQLLRRVEVDATPTALALTALAERLIVAMPGGKIVSFELETGA